MQISLKHFKGFLFMAKLYFTHATMNSGKSILLLQVNHNYIEEDMRSILISHSIDNRFGDNVIASRLGVSHPCLSINENTNIFDLVKDDIAKHGEAASVLVDEVQFCTPEQIMQLTEIVDDLDIPVLCYGIKTDFKGELFPGIAKLFAVVDVIQELRQVCHCGSRSNMVLRYDEHGNIERDGTTVVVGSESMYRSVCRKHWKEGNLGPRIYKKLGIPDPFKK